MLPGFDLFYLVYHQDWCNCFCLSVLMPPYFITWWSPFWKSQFSPKRPGVPGRQEASFTRGVGGSIDIWPLTTGRNLIWNFVQVGAYLQSHYKSCLWNMIGSTSLDKRRIPVWIHWEPTLLTAITMGFISLPALHSPHSFFVVIHLNLFLCSKCMIFWQLFV